MRPLVMKFGGTSVADAPSISRVVEIVRRAAASPTVVVVSAMARMTDELLSACELARLGRIDELDARVDAIAARHREAVATLFAADRQDAERVFDAIETQCEELRAVLRSVAVLRELTPRGADRVVAAGELMSSRIVAAALRHAGVPAEWVDARRTVVTDDGQPAAPSLFETRTAATSEVRPVLERGDVAVLGGFIGATRDGITTTLGRGGSDLSGSLLGAALHAREIQIWTDVDGMLTADPRVVSGAQVVPHLSFNEASELAYFGAKVLHPSTILPAVHDGIPVRILNTHHPENPGSLITPEAPPGAAAVTALACKRNISVVDVTSTRMLLAHGFLRRVFEVFEDHTTSVDVVTTSEVSVSMTLDDDRRLEAIVHDLRSFAEVSVDRGMAILSVVGDNLTREPHLAVRLIAALDGFPLRMVSQAASRRNLTVVLSDRDLPNAMLRLHEEFFSVVGDAMVKRQLRVLLVGYGRMGRLVEQQATDAGVEIVGRVTSAAPLVATANEADVAIDFSTASAVPANLATLAAHGISVVIGTTGWQDREDAARAAVREFPVGVLVAPNFAIGVNAFFAIAERAAALLAARGFAPYIHEAHHSAKKDAPSGTALMLQAIVTQAGGQAPDMASTRAGFIPGTHTVGFDAVAETITVTHTARDRTAFARGALEAAKWIRGRQGWFTMRDMLGL